MQVFAVFNVSRSDAVQEAVATRFPSDSLRLPGGAWLVAAHGSNAKDIGDLLGVSEGQNGNAIIVPMDAYWGRAPKEVWDWIDSKRAGASG